MIAFWHKHENISEVILSHVFLNRKTTVLCNNGGIIRPRHRVFVKNNCMGTQSIHNNCCGIKREREKMSLFSSAFRWCCVCKAFSCGEYESSSSATKCSPFRWLYSFPYKSLVWTLDFFQSTRKSFHMKSNSKKALRSNDNISYRT